MQTRIVSQALIGTPANDFALHITHKIPDALRHTCASSVHAVILDVDTSLGHGMEIFEQLFACARHLPLVILCGPANEHIARDAVKRGAKDYLLNLTCNSSACAASSALS